MITKQDLLRLKKRALRLNVWFKTLSSVERAIVDLTLKCVERVRSCVLEATISTITDKILGVLELGFIAKAQKIGREIAKQSRQIAEKWGNTGASGWGLDVNFVTFLGSIALNQ